MGGNIVLNLIRTTFAALIAVFLLILVGQRNSLEERMRSIQVAQTEATERDEKAARNLKTLRAKVERIDKVIRSGALTAAPANGGTVQVPVDEELDPRTLPHWPNEDNILVDLSKEPVPPADAPEGGEINFFVGSNLRSLNPFVNSDVDQTDRVCTYVYDYLASSSMDNPDNLIPGLANRVTISEDKKVFGIYLRKGVMWHPPTLSDEERRGDYKWLADLGPQEVSAHDVKFTFDIVRHPLSECSSQASYLGDIEQIEIVDRYALNIHWKSARYYNKASTLSLLMMLPQHIWGRDDNGKELPIDQAAQRLQSHWYNKRMCGTGPMQFAEFADNSHIRLERNDDYWGAKPKIDAIVLKIVEDPEMRLSLFKTGELDLFRPEPSQWRAEYLEGSHDGSLKKMEESGAASLHMVTAFVYRYIGWNQKRPIFRDARVRRALAHCFPKDRVVRDVFFGLAMPHDAPVHPDLPYYVKDLEQFDFDLKKAAALLDEAGWKPNEQGIREKVIDGETVSLDFKILMPNSRPIYRQFGLIFQKELAKVGVQMKLDLREWQKMITQLDNKDFDACSLGWGLSYDSDESQIWGPAEADKPRSSNHIAYKSEELGRVIDEMGREFDPARRLELHERFQRVIVKDQPYLFLNVPKMPWFVNNRLGNHYFNKLRPQIFLLPWFVKE